MDNNQTMRAECAKVRAKVTCQWHYCISNTNTHSHQINSVIKIEPASKLHIRVKCARLLSVMINIYLRQNIPLRVVHKKNVIATLSTACASDMAHCTPLARISWAWMCCFGSVLQSAANRERKWTCENVTEVVLRLSLSSTSEWHLSIWHWHWAGWLFDSAHTEEACSTTFPTAHRVFIAISFVKCRG